MKRMILTSMQVQQQDCLAIACLEDGRIMELQLETPEKQRLLGSIHVAKVQKVLPNIKGAFVEIQGRIPCFYPYARNQHPIFTNGKHGDTLKPGDELLVQVTQEALKTKAPCVSSNLSFPGTCLVLTTENRQIGISSKIAKSRGQELRAWMEELLPDTRTFGVVLRTNARDATREQLKAELELLTGQMDQILKKGSYSPCFTCIMKGPSFVDNLLKNIYWTETEKIITDDPEIFETIHAYVQNLSISSCSVEFYEDRLLPLAKLYRLETGLAEALSEKVWLKSGGFLVIQQTEAFVSIDVNSGKRVEKKSSDDAHARINLEAAREIARQIQLRNLYGMILIDFINMKKADQDTLLHAMKSFVQADRGGTLVVDVTALGIMELTRRKKSRSLAEQVRDLKKGDT